MALIRETIDQTSLMQLANTPTERESSMWLVALGTDNGSDKRDH